MGQLVATGTTTEVVRRVASEYGKGDEQALTTAVREGTTVLLLIAIVLVGTFVIVARPVVLALFPSTAVRLLPHLPILLVAIVSLLGIQLVLSGYVSVLNGLQRSDLLNWSGLVAAFCSAAMTISGLSFGLGIWSLVAADGSQILVQNGGALICIRRAMPNLHFGFTRISVRVFRQFAVAPVGVAVASAATLFDSQIDKLILSASVGPAAAAMFQIGTVLVIGAKAFAVAPLTVLLAGTAELFQQRARLDVLESVAVPVAQSIAALTAGVFVLFAPSFIFLWIGPNYHGATLSMRVMALAVAINMWSAPWFYYIAGRGRYRYIAIAAAVTAFLNAASTAFLTTRIGLDGALIGSVAGSCGGTFTAWLMVRRLEDRHWFRPVIRAVVPVVAMTAVAVLAFPSRIGHWWVLIAYMAGYGVAGVSLLTITGALPLGVVVSSLLGRKSSAARRGGVRSPAGRRGS